MLGELLRHFSPRPEAFDALDLHLGYDVDDEITPLGY